MHAALGSAAASAVSERRSSLCVCEWTGSHAYLDHAALRQHKLLNLEVIVKGIYPITLSKKLVKRWGRTTDARGAGVHGWAFLRNWRLPFAIRRPHISSFPRATTHLPHSLTFLLITSSLFCACILEQNGIDNSTHAVPHSVRGASTVVRGPSDLQERMQ